MTGHPLYVQDIESLAHALGIGAHLDRDKWGYRKHYDAPDCDLPSMERLVAAGLMEKLDMPTWMVKNATYLATQKARDLFGLGPEVEQ